jgi:hypothetical protein
MVAPGRHRALAADDFGLAAAHVVQNQRRVAAGTAEMRLDDLQGEGGGHGRVEGVAAPFEDAHADGGRDPVCGGDDAERADDLGARSEGIGIDELHGLLLARAAWSDLKARRR